jgi:hypothetical protein
MSTTTTPVPVIITPEVSAYVAGLGMQTEFDRMLEYTRQNVADLGALHISLVGPYDDGDVPCVVFDAQLSREAPLNDDTWHRWSDWFLSTFPRKAFGRFQLRFTPPEPGHAG